MDDIVKPLISELTEEIKIVFEIPGHLKGFSVFDSESLPRKSSDLGSYGKDSIEILANFYGSPLVNYNNTAPPIISSESLKNQFEIFKVFVLKKRLT